MLQLPYYWDDQVRSKSYLTWIKDKKNASGFSNIKPTSLAMNTRLSSFRTGLRRDRERYDFES